jgi:hypothetical protein
MWERERRELRKELADLQQRLQQTSEEQRHVAPFLPVAVEPTTIQPLDGEDKVASTATTDDDPWPWQDGEPTIEPAPRTPDIDTGPENVGASAPAPGEDFIDPAALERMVRFARQKRGRWAPTLKTASLVALWTFAGLVVVVAVVWAASRWFFQALESTT